MEDTHWIPPIISDAFVPVILVVLVVAVLVVDAAVLPRLTKRSRDAEAATMLRLRRRRRKMLLR